MSKERVLEQIKKSQKRLKSFLKRMYSGKSKIVPKRIKENH